MRRDLPALIRILAVKPGLSDLALTTNGVLLAEQIDALRAAGLGRITVSLDTLRSDRFDGTRAEGGAFKTHEKGPRQLLPHPGVTPCKTDDGRSVPLHLSRQDCQHYRSSPTVRFFIAPMREEAGMKGPATCRVSRWYLQRGVRCRLTSEQWRT